MENDFVRLVTQLNISPLSNEFLQQITRILQQQTDQSLSSFVSQVYPSLVILEHRIWQILSFNPDEWFSQVDSLEFFQTLAFINKKLIFNQDNIKDDMKIALLMPETIDQINSLLQQIQQSHNDNDLLITIASLWFDNLAFFVHEYPRFGSLPAVIHISQYFGQHFVNSEQFKSYLIRLGQSPLLPSIFTAKQLFYIKTCSCFLNAYFYTNPQAYEYTPEEILGNIRDEYIQIIQVQSNTIESWSKNLLACMTHLIGFMRALLWWEGEKGTKLKILFTTEKVLGEYIQAVTRIIAYEPFYKDITTQWSNDETILIDSVLLSLMNIIQSQNMNWFFRSLTQLPSILVKLTELSAYFRIYLCAYGILSEILTDEHVKELKFTGGVRVFFFDLLEQGWHDPSKRYKQIPIDYMLKGFLNLSKNDFIQQETAKLNGISLFIEMCDQYPIVFDIIWGLSFNQDIQQQLRSSSTFMAKLAHLEKDCDDERMKKTIHGILWNLEINHEDRPVSDTNDEHTFDIMISYSHKEKELCKQIYTELTKAGYRVWIDFDQMHGNVMDAMAQAIECSQTVIICMSEQYRKSNYCRAEAHYAFQRQRKIVPVLLQKHYKPDGWLLFLIGQLLYIDFNKHEFNRAMKMLLTELKVEDKLESNVIPIQPTEDMDVAPPVVSVASSPTPMTSPKSSQNILDWTPRQVQEWLVKHQLIQMSQILADCDGRSLIYLNKYMKSCQSQQILNLLQDDSLRRTKQNISLVELSRFHSLLDQQKRYFRSTEMDTTIEKKDL